MIILAELKRHVWRLVWIWRTMQTFRMAKIIMAAIYSALKVFGTKV